jgi:hypothetical protein
MLFLVLYVKQSLGTPAALKRMLNVLTQVCQRRQAPYSCNVINFNMLMILTDDVHI